MDNILEELKSIKLELEFIKSELQTIKSGTKKMETHISFVDSIYYRVKSPFHYILDAVSKYKQLEN
jgi:hypothetical protein